MYQLGVPGSAVQLINALPKEYTSRFNDMYTLSKREAYGMVRLVTALFFARELPIDERAVRKLIKGMWGEIELITEVESRKIPELENAVIFNNLFLDSEREGRCQLDHVITSRRGIYHIETKNWTKRYYREVGPRSIFFQVVRARNILLSEIYRHTSPCHRKDADTDRHIPIHSIIYTRGFRIDEDPPEGIDTAVNSSEIEKIIQREEIPDISRIFLDHLNGYLHSRLQRV